MFFKSFRWPIYPSKGVDFERHVTECPIHLALLKTADLMGFKTQIPADREGVNIGANESEFPSLILEHIHEQAERPRRECPTGIFKTIRQHHYAHRRACFRCI